MRGVVFKDHFSEGSAEYARRRPTYPADLYRFLAGACEQRECAWDVGTGSGQAAVALAEWFGRVIATDGSDRQIAAARPHPAVAYRVAMAESSGLSDAGVDLVPVAQALHWFEQEAFFEEVRRVARPGAVVAAWTYRAADIAGAVGAVVRRYDLETMAPYWPPERRHVACAYRSLELPFEPLTAPPFSVTMRLDCSGLIGYLETWSATRAARRSGPDPLPAVARELAAAWPRDEPVLDLRMPLYVLAGRVRSA